MRNSFLNICKQTLILNKIETFKVAIVYKNKDMPSTTYSTFCKVLSAKTVSDCSLSYWRPFKNLSFPYPTWLNKVKSTKNHFCALFHSAKSISGHFRTSKNFEFFFKIRNFYMFRPLHYLGEKSEVNKKSLLSALL